MRKIASFFIGFFVATSAYPYPLYFTTWLSFITIDTAPVNQFLLMYSLTNPSILANLCCSILLLFVAVCITCPRVCNDINRITTETRTGRRVTILIIVNLYLVKDN